MNNLFVEWYIPNRVILTYLWDSVTLADIEAGTTKADNMIQQGQAPVHDIIDTRHLKYYPKNLGLISKTTGFLKEPNMGWMVMISDNSMVKFFGATLTQMTHTHLKTVANPEEALEFLRKADATLPEFLSYEDMVKEYKA